MIRGGLGLFYDLGYGNVGIAGAYFPYQRNQFVSDSRLPFNPATSPASAVFGRESMRTF